MTAASTTHRSRELPGREVETTMVDRTRRFGFLTGD